MIPLEWIALVYYYAHKPKNQINFPMHHKSKNHNFKNTKSAATYTQTKHSFENQITLST